MSAEFALMNACARALVRIVRAPARQNRPMSFNGAPPTGDYFYTNLSMVNEASAGASGTGDADATVTEARGAVILDAANKYRLSPVRFSVTGAHLPAVIADIEENQPDPNLTVWGVGLSYGFTTPTGLVQVLKYVLPVSWVPAYTDAPLPPVDPRTGWVTRATLSAALGSHYYWSPSVSWVLRAFNTAMAVAAGLLTGTYGAGDDTPAVGAALLAAADARPPSVSPQAGVSVTTSPAGTTIYVSAGADLGTTNVRVNHWRTPGPAGANTLNAFSLAPYIGAGFPIATVSLTIPDPATFTTTGGTYTLQWAGVDSAATFGVRFTAAGMAIGEAVVFGPAGAVTLSVATGDRLTFSVAGSVAGGAGATVTAWLNDASTANTSLGLLTINEQYKCSLLGGVVTAPFSITNVRSGSSFAPGVPINDNAVGATNTVTLANGAGGTAPHVAFNYSRGSITLGPSASEVVGTGTLGAIWAVKQGDGAGSIGGFGGGAPGCLQFACPRATWTGPPGGVRVSITPTNVGLGTVIHIDISCNVPTLAISDGSLALTGLPWTPGMIVRVDQVGYGAVYGAWSAGSDPRLVPPNVWQFVSATGFKGTGSPPHSVNWTPSFGPLLGGATEFAGRSATLTGVASGPLIFGAYERPAGLGTLPTFGCGNPSTSSSISLMLDQTAFPLTTEAALTYAPAALFSGAGWGVLANTPAWTVLRGLGWHALPRDSPADPTLWCLLRSPFSWASVQNPWALAGTVWAVTPEYPSGDSWSAVASLAFSTAMPIVTEQDTAPRIVGGAAGEAAASTTVDLVNVMTDIALPLAGGPTDYMQMVSYIPQAEYRWVALVGAASVWRGSFTLKWRARADGVLRDLKILPGGRVEIKTLFERIAS